MKEREVIIKVALPGGSKLASGIKTRGFSDDNASDQLMLLGIVENVKFIIQERLKKIAEQKN